MNFFKKIFCISLLGIMTLLYFNTEGKNSFANIKDSKNISSNIENRSIEEILSMKESEPIKRINLDSNGNPISSTPLSEQESRSGLADGLYTIDRGDGWVLGKDKGFLISLIVPKGASGILSTSKTIDSKHTISVSMSTGFDLGYIKMAIKSGYGYSFGENKTEFISKSISAPKDKNLFVKTQAVYRNIEVINVKNGEIIDSAKTFTPSGHSFSSIKFNDDENVIQAKLYENVDRCILGDPGYEIKNIRNQNASYHSKVLNVNNVDTGYYTLDTTKQGKPFGLYFNVPESRKYEIKDIVFMDTYWHKGKGHGTGMRLYKVNENNDNDIELIASVPANFKTTDFLENKFNGQGITIDLKVGEKYLLMLNEDMSVFWSYANNADINYRVQFNKKEI